MNRIRSFRRGVYTSAALFSVLALSGIARGDVSIQGSTSGTFINPNPSGSPIVTTGVGTSSFTWGQGDPNPPNSMNFAGGPFNTTTGTSFELGTLTYFNGTTDSGTTPMSVQLSVSLAFTMPAGAGTQTSAFTLNLDSTPNTGTAQQNADFVTFPSGFSNTIFTVSGTKYTLELTGFENVTGNAGFLGSNGNTEFHVEEGGTASAQLFGMVTSDLSGVSVAPEPSTFYVGAMGAAGLIAYGLRRRKA
jgi:hypothetical protein